MKPENKQKGKASKYVIYSERGLLKDDQWKSHLKNRPLQLVTKIRSHLKKRIPGLADKFNYKSRYFGLRVKDDKDRIYIYVQKCKLLIDVDIDQSCSSDLEKAGFQVKPRDNFQAKVGWLTGWLVPHDTEKINVVLKWINKAFENTL